MADETKEPATPPDTDDKPKAKKPKVELVRLQHPIKESWTLRIDTSEYAVVDGVVEVPLWHFDAAHQAGFR